MAPSSASTKRKSAIDKVVLPEPVAPTIPTFSPPRTVKETFLSTFGRPGAYLTDRFRTSMVPLLGHAADGRGSTTSGASAGSSEYSLHLSTLVKPICVLVRCRVTQKTSPLARMVMYIANPAKPGDTKEEGERRAATPTRVVKAVDTRSKRTESHLLAYPASRCVSGLS